MIQQVIIFLMVLLPQVFAVCEDGQAFCKWWQHKHFTVKDLGKRVKEQIPSGEINKIDIVKWTAYVLTHAKLEDTAMWDQYRQCSGFNSTHEHALTQNQEQEEGSIAAIDNLQRALESTPCVQGKCSPGSLVDEFLRADKLINEHIDMEEQVVQKYGIMTLCDVGKRWDEIMATKDLDGRTLILESVRLGLTPEEIMDWLFELIERWWDDQEVQHKTIERMQQFRHNFLNSDSHLADVTSVLLERCSIIGCGSRYLKWLSIERKTGIQHDILNEVWNFFSLGFRAGKSRVQRAQESMKFF